MAKKNKKTSLLTKQLEIRDDIPQLITATAIEHFPLLKKANIDIYLQIAILKEYTDRYYLEKIYYNEALPAIESDPKLAKELKHFLSKVHDFCTTEACGSKEENQARLQKIRDRRFTEVNLDKFKEFKTTVNKYSAFINIKSLFSDLDDEKIALDTTKRILVLFNQALPYYANEIRGCFDLEQLFVKFEKVRSAFFENLTLLLSKQPEPTHPEFFFLKQVQVYVLCAAMMWINHAKNLNSDLDPAIFFVLNTLSDLLPHRLKAFMFADYALEETDSIAMLPSPLNMIGVLIEHYQNEKAQRNEENEKLDHLLSSLQTIKKRFIDKMQGNFLQDALKQEFIFFLDRLLAFVLSTNQTGYRAKILEYYNRFLPLIDELIKDSSQTDRLHCLKSIKTKWDNFINENYLAHQTSEQKGSELIHEQQQIKVQLQQQQLAKDQAIQAKANENTARRFAEKKQKQLHEAAMIAMKRQARLAETSLSPIDHIQSELQRKIASGQQNISTDEKFKIKEKNSREEICRCLKIDPIEKIDENSLIRLKNHVIASEDELSSNVRHTLLILCISLADNYLSRITHSISYYKKHYAPSLKSMTIRHGQRDFGKSDHEAYQKIKGFMEPALENLMLTGNDCECLLSLFEMIACLRQKIENKEFYRLWNLAAAFRKEEHKDLHKNFLENLQQLKIYRERKKLAFKALPKSNKPSNLNNSVKLDGKMIDETLESLITAIKKITEILAKNDESMGYLVNVSLFKEDQLRKAQLQTAAIDENKIRKPIEYSRHECFRRSQSFHKSGLSDNHRPDQVNITYVSSRRMSI